MVWVYMRTRCIVNYLKNTSPVNPFSHVYVPIENEVVMQVLKFWLIVLISALC